MGVRNIRLLKDPDRETCPECLGKGLIYSEVSENPFEAQIVGDRCPTCWPRNPDGTMLNEDDGTAGTISVRR